MEIDIRSLIPDISPITDLGLFISRVVDIALSIAALIAFAYLVWGGIQWILAGDDKQKVEEAHTRITNALLGLAIVAVSWAVFLLIDYFLGLNVANQTTDFGEFGP